MAAGPETIFVAFRVPRVTNGVAAVRATQVPVTGVVSERDPREARGHALATTAGVTLIVLAVLGVSHGELGVDKVAVRVVVAVWSLTALILGAGLCILARFGRRRLPGASLGTSAICALCLPYLLAGLSANIPGFAVQVTFPGGSVVSTSNLETTLGRLRPAWHQPLTATLSIACVVLLVLAAWVLTAPVRAAAAARIVPGAQTAAAPAASISADAGAGAGADADVAPADATAGDPWMPTRVDESAAPGGPSTG
jgi:hypothetical protein